MVLEKSGQSTHASMACEMIYSRRESYRFVQTIGKMVRALAHCTSALFGLTISLYTSARMLR